MAYLNQEGFSSQDTVEQERVLRDLTFANFEIARLKREKEFATLMAKKLFWTSVCFLVAEGAVGMLLIILVRKGMTG